MPIKVSYWCRTGSNSSRSKPNNRKSLEPTVVWLYERAKFIVGSRTCHGSRDRFFPHPCPPDTSRKLETNSVDISLRSSQRRAVLGRLNRCSDLVWMDVPCEVTFTRTFPGEMPPLMAEQFPSVTRQDAPYSTCDVAPAGICQRRSHLCQLGSVLEILTPLRHLHGRNLHPEPA